MIPKDVPPPGHITRAVPEVRTVSPMSDEMNKLHERAIKLVQHIAAMSHADVARCPDQPMRWMSQLMAEVIVAYARALGAEGAHNLLVRIAHLLRGVVGDVAYQVSQL